MKHPKAQDAIPYKSYFAHYYSTDPERLMLGGIREGQSSYFSHEQDALDRLDAVISIHAGLAQPLSVAGSVLRSQYQPEIRRHCLTAQAIGYKCPECGALV